MPRGFMRKYTAVIPQLTVLSSIHLVPMTKDQTYPCPTLSLASDPDGVFSPIEFLGKGGYGAIIYYASKDRPPIAVKFPLSDPPEKIVDRTQNIQFEARIMKLIPPHPNIVGLLFEGPYFFAMDVGGKPLSLILYQDFLRDPHTQAKIFLQLAEALAFLHDLGIVHGDFSRGNILVDDNRRVHLCDFGSATETSPEKRSRVLQITSYPYRAPEIATMHVEFYKIYEQTLEDSHNAPENNLFKGFVYTAKHCLKVVFNGFLFGFINNSDSIRENILKAYNDLAHTYPNAFSEITPQDTFTLINRIFLLANQMVNHCSECQKKLGFPRHQSKIDTWALGLVGLEILRGQALANPVGEGPIDRALDHSAALTRLHAGLPTPGELANGFPPNCPAFFILCSLSPHERPTAAEAVLHFKNKLSEYPVDSE